MIFTILDQVVSDPDAGEETIRRLCGLRRMGINILPYSAGLKCDG